MIIAFFLIFLTSTIYGQPQRLAPCKKSIIEIATYSNADTSLICVIGENVSDTTLCASEGVVIGFHRYLPIKNVTVNLADSIIYHTGNTGVNGRFRIVSCMDLRTAKPDLQLRHSKYKCLVIKNICQPNNSLGEIIGQSNLSLNKTVHNMNNAKQMYNHSKI